MASSVATETIFSKLMMAIYDHDPGAATAIVCSPDGGTTKRTVDMRDYLAFGVIATPKVLAGAGITLVEIIAAALATMASPEVIKTSGTVAADAVGDTVVLECSAAEIAQIAAETGKDLRHVAARITCADAGDEADVVYVGVPKKMAGALTATAIA